MKRVAAYHFQLFLLRLGWQRFLQGFYYYKFLEYPLVYNNLGLSAASKYLDIGSGQSIFPLFVLQKQGCDVHIVDDGSIIDDSQKHYQKMLQKMNYEDAWGKKLIFQNTQDHGLLPFPDESFEVVSCISVIEHIRGDGDSAMMRDIARVLKSGGRAVVSFPFNNGDFIEEENSVGVGYFQRRYNVPEIQRRIIAPCNLAVEKVIYFKEVNTEIGMRYMKGSFKSVAWLLPFFSPFLWRVAHSYEGDFRTAHETVMDQKNIGVACLVFSKK
jgi:SAM-dependent methyltransferase